MTPKQSRAARAVLGWTTEKTATEAKLSGKATVSHFENAKTKPHPKTTESLKSIYENAGVSFGDNGLSISWQATK